MSRGYVILDVGVVDPQGQMSTTPLYLFQDGDRYVVVQWTRGNVHELTTDRLSFIAQMKMGQLGAVSADWLDDGIHIHTIRDYQGATDDILQILNDKPNGSKVFFLTSSAKFDKYLFAALGIDPHNPSPEQALTAKRLGLKVNEPFTILEY